MTSISPKVRAPIVVAATDADLGGAIAAAARRGAIEVARHSVGRGAVVIEFELVDGGGVGASSSVDASAQPRSAEIVKGLRAEGVTAIDGPRSAGHAVAWSARNAPVFFGADACVCMPWSVFDREPVPTVVEINPGTGFGSGGHPTTLMLLRRLRTMNLAGLRVLDVGSGSGVLSVAAALLGAASVTALDIAPAAVVATEHNAHRNGVADRVAMVEADLGALDDRFDLILANIKAEVLISMAPDLRRLCGPLGMLAVSGLSPAQPSKLVAALAPMVLVWADESAEWVAVSFEWTS